jgi:DEAD/DEAH box helicase domain-containing protein
VNLSLEPDSIVDGHLLSCDDGLVAEVQLQVTEAVEGYRIGNVQYSYRDLRATNPSMTRKQRDFRTTGILVRIEQDWFAGGNSQSASARRQIAEGLKDLLARERSIAPQDIDATHTNIAIMTDQGPQRVTDAVVIYDAVYGGLRLTEDLFMEFQQHVEQLVRGAELAGDDALVLPTVAAKLKAWSECLEEAGAAPATHVAVPDGWLQIYRPGSELALYMNNTLVSVIIGKPQYVDVLGTRTLIYAYERHGGIQMVPHAQLQTVGQDWQWALWNPESGDIRDIDDPDDSVDLVSR